MFFWLIAIPFFVIIAMFTLFRLPSSDLNQPEEMQDAAMAFRMAMQHDAAAKLMQEYQGSSESDMFDEGSYDLGGDTWKETILESGYLPSSFIPDTDNITTYVRCVNGLRQIASCRGANGIYMITAATPPSGESITARWFEQKGAQNLATQLNKYEGSFPVKQGGLVLPRKPRKEEDESDEDFAIRLNAYKETKAQYKLLKRNYYDFGDKLPRPNTVVGEVRAYPFNSESAESRVILTRMKVIEGEVHFDSELMPTDLPVGGEGSDSLDFNGEAVILTASFKQPDSCVTVYEAKNISTSTLSSTVQEIGTYTIPVAGNYKITLMGEAGYYLETRAAGGILTANTYYDADTLITIKGIKGYEYDPQQFGGTGVALWDTINTTGAPTLVAGGGAHMSAGGYLGGSRVPQSEWSGYSWNGSQGGNTYCCLTTPCDNGATGGCYYYNSSNYGPGGTGTGSSGYPCPSGYTCTTTTGGSARQSGSTAQITYPASSYGNWSANHDQALGYASITYCGPDAESFCSTYPCDTTKTCLIANDCPSNKPYCNNGECSDTQILTCDSTSYMPTDTWIAGWANCTSCPAGQFKDYQSRGENGENCAYPVTSTAGCVNIPALNSYTTLPTAVYGVPSWATASNVNMWHRQVNITCNGKNEEWDLIGPFLGWWEAQEICAKLGKKMPANYSVLTGGCSEGARWSLIKNATAVGTGQTLTAVSGIVNANGSWNSSTGNVTSSYHWIHTNQDYGNSCSVWIVFLSTGAKVSYRRDNADSIGYALCGPAQ